MKRYNFRHVNRPLPARPIVSNNPRYEGKGGAGRLVTDIHNYNQSLSLYKRERRSVVFHNTTLAVSLAFRVIAVALALGFVFVLWGNDFSFHDIMIEVMHDSVAPFDFVGLVGDLNSWVADLPDWLGWVGSPIRAIAMIFLSLGYLIGFVLNLIGIVFA